MQRTSGIGRLAVKHLDGRSRIGRLYQEGAARILMPKTPPDAPLEAVLINTAGGLTGGDSLEWQVEVARNASATLTTQACEKIYRSAEGAANVETRISVGGNAILSWLPQETILFDRSALSRKLEVDLADNAAALVVEPLVFGRQAMGERVSAVTFHDRWRIRQDGRPLHADDLRIAGDAAALLDRASVARGRIAFASLVFVHPDAVDLVDRARSIIGDHGGASAWRMAGREKLTARLIADDALGLRRRLIPLIALLCGHMNGRDRDVLPKVWNI